MKLIDKYIFKQVLMATILGVIIFIVFWISPEILIRIIRETMNGQITFPEAVKLFFYEIPDILSKAIPVGLMLGALFVFDKLSRDSELVVMRCVGVSLKRLIFPVLIIGSVASVFCFITYDYLIPSSEQAMMKLKGVESKHFVYVDKDKDGAPKTILIVGGFDNKEITEVKYLRLSKSNSSQVSAITEILSSEKASYSKGKWILGKGLQYEIAEDGVYKNINNYGSKVVMDGSLGVNAYKLMKNSVKKPLQMNLKQLNEHYRLLDALNIEDEKAYFKNKIYQRYSMPFSCVLFGICGVILGYGKPREKKFIGLVAGICLVFLYFITMPFIDLLAEHKVVLPIISVWLPNLFVLGTAVGFWKYRKI